MWKYNRKGGEEMKAKCFIKLGDKVVVTKAKNSSKGLVGVLCEVTEDKYVKDGYVYTTPIKEEDKKKIGQSTMYLTDDWKYVSRKEHGALIREEVRDSKIEFDARIKELEAEADLYEKYDSEEDYVAHKIQKILKADGEKGISKVLKELKRTDYI